QDYGANRDQMQHVGLLVYLLPYVEQEGLYRRLQLELDPRRLGPAWYTNATNWRLAQTRVKVFECPSDNIAGDTATWGTGLTFHFFNTRGPIVPNADDNTWYEGVFSNRSQTPLNRITDGTSNTLLLGEAYGGDNHGRRRGLPCWMGLAPER